MGCICNGWIKSWHANFHMNVCSCMCVWDYIVILHSASIAGHWYHIRLMAITCVFLNRWIWGCAWIHLGIYLLYGFSQALRNFGVSNNCLIHPSNLFHIWRLETRWLLGLQNTWCVELLQSDNSYCSKPKKSDSFKCDWKSKSGLLFLAFSYGRHIQWWESNSFCKQHPGKKLLFLMFFFSPLQQQLVYQNSSCWKTRQAWCGSIIWSFRRETAMRMGVLQRFISSTLLISY